MNASFKIYNPAVSDRDIGTEKRLNTFAHSSLVLRLSSVTKPLVFCIFLTVWLIHEVTASGSRALESFPFPKCSLCCLRSRSQAGKNDATTACWSSVSEDSRPTLFLLDLSSGAGEVSGFEDMSMNQSVDRSYRSELVGMKSVLIDKSVVLSYRERACWDEVVDNRQE